MVPLVGPEIPDLGPLADVMSFVKDMIVALTSDEAAWFADKFSSVILLIPNLLLLVVFTLLAALSGLFYDILLLATTRTPVPKNENDEAVIFGTPASDDPFAPMQVTIEESIVPVALVFVVVGIAIVLFIRVFDVVIDFSFQTEEAQRRLLLAPILISLWVPLANMILAMAMGLTDLFMSVNPTIDDTGGIPISSSGDSQTVDAIDLLVSGATDAAPTDLEGDPVDFVTEMTSDGYTTLMQLMTGIWVAIFVVIVATIAAFLALIRLTLLYVLYALGPVGIMMWSITWRDIGDLGEKIVRYFVLLALFPVPAALVNSMMPVIAVAIEQALVGAQGELAGDIAGSDGTELVSYLGYGGLIRSSLVAVIVTVVGFAPWALVIGVSKATALAGTAAMAGGAVATGGTALAAGGALKGGMAANKKAGGAALSAGGKLGGAASKVGSKAGSAASKYGGKATSGAKRFAKDNMSEDRLSQINTARERASGLREDIAENASKPGRYARSGVSGASSLAEGAKERAGENRAGRYALDKGSKAKEVAKEKAADAREEAKIKSKATMNEAMEQLDEVTGDDLRENLMMGGSAAGSKGSELLSSGLRTAGFNQTANVVDKSRDTFRKEKDMLDKGRKRIGAQEAKVRSDKGDEGELGVDSSDTAFSQRELKVQELLAAEEMSKNEVKQMAANSDKIPYDEEKIESYYNDQGGLREDIPPEIKETIGSAAVRHASEADNKGDLVSEFNKPMAEAIINANQADPTQENILEVVDDVDGLTEKDVLDTESGFSMERYAQAPDNLNPVTNMKGNNWIANKDIDDLDPEKRQKAIDQFAEQNAELVSSGVKNADIGDGDAAEAISEQVNGAIANSYKDGDLDKQLYNIVDDEDIDLSGVADNIQGDTAKETARNVAEKLTSSVSETVQKEIDHAEQLEIDPGTDLDEYSRSELPDNAQEKSVQATGEGEIRNGAELVNADAGDVKVDMSTLLGDSLQQEVDNMLEEAEVSSDTNINQALNSLPNTDEIVDAAIPDEEKIKQQFEETQYEEEADLDEVAKKVDKVMREQAVEQLDYEPIGEDVAKVTSETISKATEDQLKQIENNMEWFDDVEMGDIELDEITPEDIQQMGADESVKLVEETMTQTRDAVQEQIQDVASSRGVSENEINNLVNQVNNMGMDDLTAIQDMEGPDMMTELIDRQDNENSAIPDE